VVYTAPEGKIQTYVATGISKLPAKDRTFFMKYAQKSGNTQGARQQQQVDEEGEYMSVADYFASIKKAPLMFPDLPVVELKPRKNQQQMWIPPEMLRCLMKQHSAGTTVNFTLLNRFWWNVCLLLALFFL
jgi:hypothetical protein